MFKALRIFDLDPQMSIDQVRDLLTPSYPEMATATMTRTDPHHPEGPKSGRSIDE
jgi:PRTRC genetic system protein C